MCQWTALKHSCVALQWSDPFQITYIILELKFIKESFGTGSQKRFFFLGRGILKSAPKKEKEKVFGHVTRAFKGKQTAATNVSWLNLIRLTSSTAHLKKREESHESDQNVRGGGNTLSLTLSLALFLCITLSLPLSPTLRGPEWICHVIMDMLVHRWQNDNKPFEKRRKHNYSNAFFLQV